ncbi:DUF2326 domain-containing protein [Halanaerobaculum tunisiense]
MIYLKSIYSEPRGLFDKIQFNDGINIIYGKHPNKAENKSSLNSIGKTTLVNLINFCLLSSYRKGQEFYKAKDIMDDYYVVLEIEIEGKIHIVKRTTKKRSRILYGIKGGKLEEYKIKNLKKLFCDLFFKDENYSGVYSNEWFRRLIKIFTRNEKNGFKKNPIKYIHYTSELELIPYNLFLLGIDNTLARKNYKLKEKYKAKRDTRKEIKKVIKNTYGIEEIDNVNSRIANLKQETDKLEEKIKLYKLDESYSDIEKQANEITEKIKKLTFKRHSMLEKAKKYESNFDLDINISLNEIEEMYQEINEELAFNIRKTLNEAIEFKKKLVSSRRKFLKSEINNLREEATNLKEKIQELDKERSELFNILDNKGAIKDLTEAMNRISQKKEKINELEGKLKLYNDLENELLAIEKEEAELNIKIKKFIDSIQDEVNNIRKVFNQIYYSLYSYDTEGVFNISYDSGRRQAKFSIKATSSDSDGWGKARGCVLVYDLTVLFNAIKQNRRMPRFLIHDGVFNGVAKNQFVATMNLLNDLSDQYRFQYIFTANEGDTWINRNHGELEFNLEEKVIAQYSEKNKIFKQDF